MGDNYLDESKASYKMAYGKAVIKNAEGTKIMRSILLRLKSLPFLTTLS